jgi:pimeloyl-ACP methyl ester carboxylesterase
MKRRPLLHLLTASLTLITGTQAQSFPAVSPNGGLIWGANRRELGTGIAGSPGTLLKATLLRTVGTNELNTILGSDKDAFALPHATNYVVPSFTPAVYPVEIYGIAYVSSIPEKKNKKTIATGLIAIPKVGESSQRYPQTPKLISYQHGTIFGKYQCPSYAFVTNNPETQGMYSDGGYEDRLVTAVFAGRGDVVIAADYFGMGDSSESEGYSVKGIGQQACLDCYLAASSFLWSKGIRPSGLFLNGWSQGGLVTLQFLEKLEELGYPVTAASTAAAPPDPFAAINGMIFNPSPIQANWDNVMLVLSVFSYEKYYSQLGLAKEVINPVYYDRCKQVYDRKGSNSLEQTYTILFGTNTNTSIPSDFWELVQPKYHDPLNLAASTYGKDLDKNQGYRWFSFSPLHMYYGDLDQVVTIPTALLAQYYNQALGNTNITAYPVTGGNHRGTFLQAVANQKTWFDSFSGNP